MCAKRDTWNNNILMLMIVIILQIANYRALNLFVTRCDSPRGLILYSQGGSLLRKSYTKTGFRLMKHPNTKFYATSESSLSVARALASS